MSREEHKVNTHQNHAANSLGSLKALYPARNQFWKRWLFLSLGIMLILVALLLSFCLVKSTFNAIQAHGRSVVLQIYPAPIIYFGLILLLGITLIILAKLQWSDGIAIFTNGFTIHHANRTQVWFFKDIVSFDSQINQVIFGGSNMDLRVKLAIRDHNNRRAIIRNKYESTEELTENLQEKILPNLAQTIRNQLSDSQTIEFHKNIQANQVGLILKGETIPYEKIEATVKNDIIKLSYDENSKNLVFKARIDKIKNLDTLIHLINYPPLRN